MVFEDYGNTERNVGLWGRDGTRIGVLAGAFIESPSSLPPRAMSGGPRLRRQHARVRAAVEAMCEGDRGYYRGGDYLRTR